MVQPHCGFACMSWWPMKLSTFSFAYWPLDLFSGGGPLQVFCLFFCWLVYLLLICGDFKEYLLNTYPLSGICVAGNFYSVAGLFPLLVVPFDE